jgi:hypothetical protein
MTARRELLDLQRAVVARLECELWQKLAPEGPAIRRYDDAYGAEFVSGPLASSTRAELASAAAAADLVYVGDYHTLEAAQRTFVWLLERVHAARGAVAIALEMLEPLDQPALDAWLAGELDDDAFRSQVRYEERWGFSWESYRPILAFARETGSPVYGFDRRSGPDGATLEHRDRFAAGVIARVRRARPHVPLLVLVGDLHVARGHLPARVAARVEEEGLAPLRRLLVFQNADVLYWRLVDLCREQKTEVVRLDPERYCLMATTPLAKLQSFLDWAKDLRAGSIRRPSSGPALAILCEFFGVPRPARRVPELDPRVESALDAIGRASGLPGFSALDRAAEAATRALGPPLARASDPAAFHAVALVEALAFLGSLVLNHARRHASQADLRGLAAGRRPALERDGARLALRLAAVERRWLERGGRIPRPPSVQAARPLVRAVASRILGERLGARLYRALLEGRIGKPELRALLAAPRREARLAYFSLLRDLDPEGAAA